MTLTVPHLCFAVLALVGSSQAIRDFPCNPMQIMGCVMPAVMFQFTPLGMELSELKASGRQAEITETQLVSTCKFFRDQATCLANFVTPCVSADIADAHTFINATVKLLEGCDRPDLHAEAMKLIPCAVSVKPRIMEKCKTIGSNRMKYMSNLIYETALPEIQSGRVLKDICCALKETKACVDPELATCASDARGVHENLHNAIFTAYGCPAKVASGCEPVPATAA